MVCALTAKLLSGGKIVGYQFFSETGATCRGTREQILNNNISFTNAKIYKDGRIVANKGANLPEIRLTKQELDYLRGNKTLLNSQQSSMQTPKRNINTRNSGFDVDEAERIINQLAKNNRGRGTVLTDSDKENVDKLYTALNNTSKLYEAGMLGARRLEGVKFATVEQICNIACKYYNSKFIASLLEIASGYIVIACDETGKVITSKKAVFIKKDGGVCEPYDKYKYANEITQAKRVAVPMQFRVK